MATDWRDEAKSRVADKLQGKSFRLQEGRNTLRILPPYRAIQKDNFSKYKPYSEYLIHKNVGPDKRIVRCGKDIDTGEGECFLCDEIIERYLKSGKKSKKEITKNIRQQEQMYMLVARWDKNIEALKGPLPFYVPGGSGATSLAVKLVGLIANSPRHYDHPTKGYNLSITRTGMEWNNTRYGSPEPDEEPSTVPKSILRKIKPFDEVIPQYDEEFQRASFYGEKTSSSADKRKFKEEEDDAMPMKKKKKKTDDDDDIVSKKSKKKKKKDEDEDEEEIDDDEDEEADDDEEEDKPKKKKGKKKVVKKKKKAKDDDDEDEEEDDEDEEEDDEDEDEPVKKKKKKKK